MTIQRQAEIHGRQPVLTKYTDSENFAQRDSLHAYNEETENYIVSSTQTAIDSDTPTGRQFKKFYCNAVYDSYSYNSERNTCSVSTDVCTAKSGTANTYKTVLGDDLGESFITMLQIPTCGKCIIMNKMDQELRWGGGEH